MPWQPAAALTGSVLRMQDHGAFCQYPNYGFPKGGGKKKIKKSLLQDKGEHFGVSSSTQRSVTNTCITQWEGAVVAVRGRR